MKKIYLILTRTGTILSNIILTYTRGNFSHVSISLDKELNQMYSFGRLNAYNPFIGGFVHEGINRGTFKRFKKTDACIYSLEITEEEYKKIKENIQEIKKSKESYKFNLIGLFAVCISKKVEQEQSFYCAEFVKYVLENSGIKTNLPEIVKPEDFSKLNNLKLEYEGKLKDYHN